MAAVAAAETTTTERAGPPAGDSTLHSLKRAASSVRVRIVVAYLVLMGSALAVTVVIARQVQSTRADRSIELDLVYQAEELGRRTDRSRPSNTIPRIFRMRVKNYRAVRDLDSDHNRSQSLTAFRDGLIGLVSQ